MNRFTRFDYWINFKLANHTPYDGSYDERIGHLYHVIDKDNAVSVTTSFYVFNSTMTAEELVEKIGEKLLENVDIFVLKDMKNKKVRHFGKISSKLILFLDDL